MKIVEIEGLIIKSMKFKENSEILTILTKDNVLSVIAKGSLKIKSNLRMISQRLTYAKFNIYYKEDSLCTLIDGDIINNFKNIITDIKKITYASFIMDLIYQIKKDSKEELLFDLLIKSLTKINEDFDPLVIANIVELKCLKFLGVEPNLEYKCGICGKNEVSTISVDNACYVCKSCLANEYKYSEKSLKVLKLYSLVDFENLKTINVSNKVKEEIDNFLDMYYDEYTGVYLKTKDFIKKIS